MFELSYKSHTRRCSRVTLVVLGMAGLPQCVDAEPDRPDTTVLYFDADFAHESHAAEVSATWTTPSALLESPLCEQDAAWHAFHQQHAGTHFFKPRRYLLQEFSQLSAPGLCLLEIGCGSGASALPVLSRSPTARVACCDFAQSAVDLCLQNTSAYRARCDAFRADVCDESFSAAMEASAARTGWGRSFDAVLCAFVLSAVPPEKLRAALVNALSAVRAGGCLLVRDYGDLDLPQLRFAANACRGDRLFQRADGTLARFFRPEELREEVQAAAAQAGIAGKCLDTHYCCVRVTNRSQALTMKRVFVHGVWRRGSEFEVAV